MAPVLWLGEAGAHDPARVGGKAAALSRLAARYPVPPGFALTTEAFALAAREGVEALRGPVSAAYLALADGDESTRVAVRSSAVDEDGAGASFAGQHETILGVSGPAAVLDAVERCFASARSEQALAYRRDAGLSTDDVGMAVLVQRLVAAEASAVAFSANPVTHSREEVVITASFGLGESVVGGTVTPDTHVVRKTDLRVVSATIAEKERMTVPGPGGTREVAVPPLLRRRPALSDGQVAELARLVVSLEADHGHPVDVESAFGRGRLYLLQSRPITTLAA